MRPRRPWGLRAARPSPLAGAAGGSSGVTSYADQNEASPSLGAAKCETAATFAGSWEEWCHTQARMKPRRPWGLRIAKLSPSGLLGRPSGMVSYAVQNEASPSLRAANGESATTFAGSWEAQRGGVIRRPERNLPVPGGCELRNCRHFWVVLGGPAQWCHTQIRMRPRRPWGLRTAKLSPVSWLGGPADCCHTQTTVKPRRPWGLRIAKPSPLSWAPGGPSGMVSYADQSEASPSLKVANSEIAATFAGS